MNDAIRPYGDISPAALGQRPRALSTEVVAREFSDTSDIEIVPLGRFGVVELSEYLPTSFDSPHGYEATLRWLVDAEGRALKVFQPRTTVGTFVERQPCRSAWLHFSVPEARESRLFLASFTAPARDAPLASTLDLAGAAALAIPSAETAPLHHPDSERLLPESDYELGVPCTLRRIGELSGGERVRLEFSMRDALFQAAYDAKSVRVGGTTYEVYGTLRRVQNRDGATGPHQRVPMLLSIQVRTASAGASTVSFPAIADAIFDNDRGAISGAYLVDAVGQTFPRSRKAVIRVGGPGLDGQELLVDGAWLPVLTP